MSYELEEADCSAARNSITRRTAIKRVALGVAAPAFLRFTSTPAIAAESTTIVSWASAGQRWEFAQRGVYPLFEKQFPNIKVQFTADPISDMLPKTAVAMNSKTDRYDVIEEDYAYLPQFMAQKLVEPLETYLNKDQAFKADILSDIPENVLDLYRDKPLARGGVLYGLPPDSNAQLQYYRADAFEKAGITKPAETWDDAVEIAKEISEGGTKKVVGTTLKRGLQAGAVYITLLRCCGGDWFDKMEEGGWHPTLNTDQGRNAFDVLTRLLQYFDPTALNAADDEANTAMLNGTWLYAPIQWGGSTMNDPKFTKYSDAWKAGVVPKGTGAGGRHAPHMGGHGLIVPAFSKHKDAAWEWVKFSNSGDKQDPAIGETYVASTGQPARLSLLKKYSNIRPYYAALMDSLPVAMRYLPIPEAPALYEMVGTEVAAVATRSKNVDNALKDMQSQVTRIMTKSGYYKS
jgi:ABC-type glycerol-3-phosphate transport system substrate-binding protein